MIRLFFRGGVWFLLLFTGIACQQEEISKTLERRILNSEFNLYLMNMERAMELVKYFESDLVYFKDSFMMA